VKERPIIFSGPMVRAILNNQKTQTRRPMKPQPESCPMCKDQGAYPEYDEHGYPVPVQCEFCWTNPNSLFNLKQKCPYGQPGDKLWVREKYYIVQNGHFTPGEVTFVYACDCPDDVHVIPKEKEHRLFEFDISPGYEIPAFGLHPSIHMPRWASRIDLEITGVREERLQDITEKDAVAEGYDESLWLCERCKDHYEQEPISWFKYTWDSLNAKKGFGWDSNPWVWVIEFRRIRK